MWTQTKWHVAVKVAITAVFGLWLLLVGFVVGVAIVFGGDNGEDSGGAISEPTAGPYVDELLALGQTLDTRVAELQTQFQQEIAAQDDEAARLVIVKENFGEIAAARRELVQGLGDVTPPEEAAQAHGEMVAAGEAYVAALDDAVERLEDVETFEEAQAIILDPALDGQLSTFVDSCTALVDFAREGGTEIAVFC